MVPSLWAVALEWLAVRRTIHVPTSSQEETRRRIEWEWQLPPTGKQTKPVSQAVVKRHQSQRKDVAACLSVLSEKASDHLQWYEVPEPELVPPGVL